MDKIKQYISEHGSLLKNLLRNPKFWLILVVDSFFLILAYLSAYVIRFLDSGSALASQIHFSSLFLLIPVKLLVFYFFGLYRGMWRYTSYSDVLNILKATIVSSLMCVTLLLYLNRFAGLARSVFIIDALLTFLFIGGNRAAIRYIMHNYHRSYSLITRDSRGNKKKKRLLVVGAGAYAEKIIREIAGNDSLAYRVVGLVDDDPRKTGMKLHNIPVYGLVADIAEHAERCRAEEILIAISFVTGKRMQKIVRFCRETGLDFKVLPGIGQLIDGKVSVKKMRDISYEDLLGRDQVYLDQDEIGKYLTDKVVLVTGAGGTIGSELCRQIFRFQPKLIVLFDAGEENLYSIQMELLHELKFSAMVAVLGRVQDIALLHDVFTTHQPEVVFHAAAYKHVPLVENNPCQAVYNNIFAAQLLIETAIIYKVQRFVIVSTDKAVRPTNVMGASKRITELLMQAYGKESWNGEFCVRQQEYLQKIGVSVTEKSHNTAFMAVRFGNVLGSSGSVIPLFQKQIEMGGPVTVTHPEVVRYFMSISEAAQLILQAGAMGEKSEIFILKMGKPIKIVDMARDLIRLAGKKPESEIEIVFTGLRPGEKLYEELISEGEGIVETEHQQILVLHGQSLKLANIFSVFSALRVCVQNGDEQGIRDRLKELVPEYCEDGCGV